MNVVVTEYQLETPLHITKEALHAFNIYHIGQAGIPLEEEWPSSKYGYDMKDLHYRIHRTQYNKITVQVMEDGSLRVK